MSKLNVVLEVVKANPGKVIAGVIVVGIGVGGYIVVNREIKRRKLSKTILEARDISEDEDESEVTEEE